MTAPLTRANTTIWKALASFAISAMGTNAMRTSITAPVRVIARTGVPYFSWISVSDGAQDRRGPSRTGSARDERIPALAVLMRASTAAPMMANTLIGASDASAACIIRTSESLSRSGVVTPTMTTTMSTYSNVVNVSDPSIPSGMFRSGFSTSSATLAIFVTPAYDTNTRPVAARRPPDPSSKKPP